MASLEPQRATSDELLKSVQRDNRELEKRVEAQAERLVEIEQRLDTEIKIRKKVEQAYETSEKRSKEAQRIAKFGNWELDIVGGSLYWSDEVFNIFGHQSQKFEPTYESFLKAVHPDDRDMVRSAVDVAVSLGDLYNIDHRIVWPDGRTLIVHEEAEVTRDDQGNPNRMVGTVQDITARRMTEQALLQSEAKLRRVVEASGDAIIMIDKNGCIDFINNQVEQVFGYSRDELLGQPVEMLIPNRFCEDHRRERERYNENPKVRPMGARSLLWGRRKDGNEFPAEISLGPVESQEGPLVVCNIRDITVRVESEETIRRNRDSLSHIARLSTMGEMATGLAHELNQPLGAMLLYASEGVQALDDKEPADPKRLRELFERLVKLSSRSGDFIQRVRSLVAKNQSVITSVDLTSLVQDVLDLMKADLRFFNVHVKQHLKHENRFAAIDEFQIQQVFFNLVRNAWDGMGERKLEQRSLEVATLLTDDDLIQVSVCDNGTGIPIESENKIFDAYFTTKSKGMGMGLAMSRTIIESHGGSLWWTPNSDRGVTFHFTVPAAQMETNENE